MFQKIALVALALFLILPLTKAEATSGSRSSLPTDRFDLVELNHYRVNDSGFDQLIFWNWMPDYRRYRVEAWIMVSDKTTLDELPMKQPDGRWIMERREPSGHTRRIETQEFRETWTHYDPERADKKLSPDKHRLGLSNLGERR